MEAKSCEIGSGGSPLCELRSLHAFFHVFVDFVCFQTLKNRCFFVEGIANLRFLRFLLFPLPLPS